MKDVDPDDPDMRLLLSMGVEVDGVVKNVSDLIQNYIFLLFFYGLIIILSYLLALTTRINEEHISNGKNKIGHLLKGVKNDRNNAQRKICTKIIKLIST